MMFGQHRSGAVKRTGLAIVAGASLAGAAMAQVTVLASVSSSGGQGNGDSPTYGIGLRISPDGRYVVFTSNATNLTPEPTYGVNQIFQKDLVTGVVRMISVADGVAAGGNAQSYNPSVSADGRYVVFTSFADNLIPGGKSSLVPPTTPPPGGEPPAGDLNGVKDVFIRDTWTNTTTLVSVDSNEFQGNAESDSGIVSADGRFVAFRSNASNLVLNDPNGFSDIFLRDTVQGTTVLVTVGMGGAPANGISGFFQIAITPDGRYVGFTSDASNLVPGDTNNVGDVFVRDMTAGSVTRISVGAGGAQGNSTSFTCALSANGRYAAFSSNANNLVAGDKNSARDVFLRDLQTGTTTMLSVDPSGKNANGASGASDNGWGHPSISDDGRYVAFQSEASNLIGKNKDRNEMMDVFVRDVLLGKTELISATPQGFSGNGPSLSASISANGAYVAFASSASNLVSGDNNMFTDTFVRGPAR